MVAARSPSLEENYLSALKQYMSDGRETALEQAYDLGRQAIGAGVGLLELAVIHTEALVASMTESPQSDDCTRVAERAMIFLEQSLGAFEMIHSGYRDANEDLRKSESQLRLLTDSLPVQIAYVDRELRYRVVNRTCEAWYARPREELVGKHLREVVGEKAFELLRPHFESALDGHVDVVEEAIAFPDGKTRDVEITFAPQVTDGGAVVGLFLLTYDITERKAAEQRLLQAHKMEAIGRLTGGISHDFNNLLTIVIGGLEVALDRAQGEARPELESALRAAERGSALVRRMLAFGRRQMLAPTVLRLNEIVSDMEDLLRRSLGEEIRIEMRLDPTLWPTVADKSQVENALLNLAVNSRDSMPEGGTLVIETGNVHVDESAPAPDGKLDAGDYVVLSVTDTGRGMPPAVAARVFEPFFTTKEPGKGTGLGLSTIYGFARQSGGSLQIRSEPGQGTTVRLYLPRRAGADLASAPLEPAPSSEPLSGKTIVVVEDNPDLRLLVVSQLRGLGYEVVEAANGEEAERVFQSTQEVDLLMTDLFMSDGLTGRQLVEIASRRSPHMQTLLTSGYADGEMLDDGRLRARVHFLPKPFRRHDLANKVREVLAAG